MQPTDAVPTGAYLKPGRALRYISEPGEADIMSESAVSTTELTSQYAAQVTSDLEHNIKEQERITAEIASLHEQLSALQHDHAVLVNMQQALGVTAPAVAGTVPVPRRRNTAGSGSSKNSRTKKGSSDSSRTGRGKRAEEKPAAAAGKKQAATPKLVDLIRQYLVEQGEPRSAAEVTTALNEAHPDRGVKTTVVRNTLEGLVAKNQAQRAKQGSSVFYTGPDAQPATAAAPEAQSDQPEN